MSECGLRRSPRSGGKCDCEMRIIRTAESRGCDRAAADIILGQMRSKANSVIALSTGRTTAGIHALVSEDFKASALDSSRMTFIGIDEVTGIEDTNPWACKAKLKREIIDNLNLPESGFMILPTEVGNISKLSREFLSELDSRGGIDLMILGLGENGHIGFNQPGTPFDSSIHLSTMDSDLERRIKEDCGFGNSVKLGGITLGIKDIMAAKKIVLVVKGALKSDIVEKAVKGPVTEQVPASILQTHPDCIVLGDEDALSNI